MAGPWGGATGGSSGSSPWGGGALPSPSRRKKKKSKKDGGGRSFGGLVGNFAGEVGALAGIPMGLASLGKSLVQDPVATGKSLAGSAWDSHIVGEFKQAAKGPTPIWSKEARKDFQFMYEHPLQSVLDVTLVGGVAVSAAARLGRVAKVESLTKVSTPTTVKLKDPTGKGRPDIELATGRGKFVSPMRQGRKHLTHQLMPERMKAARYERHRAIRDRRDLTTVENAWTAMFAAAKAITERGPVRQAKQAAIVKDMHRVYSGIGNEFNPGAKPKDYDWIRRPEGPHRANARHGYSFVETKNGFREVKGDKGVKTIKSGEGFVLRKAGKYTWRKERGVGLESDYTPAAFEESLMNGRIREMFTTKDPNSAVRGPNGLPLAAPKKVVDNYIKEAVGSHKSLTDLVENTTRPWRALVLGTPRYAFNNVVGGTSIMLLNNPTGFKYYVKAWTDVHGKKKAQKLLNANPGKGVSWVDAAFGHVRGHGFVREIPKFKVGGKKGKILGFERWWYDYVNRWSEETYRVSALVQRVRKDPEIAAMKKQGLSEHEAVMAKATQDRQWTHQVSDDIDDMFGQYYYHNKLERNIRSLGVPFYGWYRAISRSTTNTFKDRPGRGLALMQLGEYGEEETKKALGDIPEFMRGVVPLGGFLEGTPKGGRKSVLATHAMNPWNTPADVMRGVSSLMGGGGRTSETLGGMFGPVPATVIESLTGRDLLTDVPHKKPAYAIALENFGLNPERGSLPQIQLGQFIGEQLGLRKDVPGTYEKSSGGSAEKLYDPDAWNTLLGLHGFPRKYVSPKAAKKRKKQEDPY